MQFKITARSHESKSCRIKFSGENIKEEIANSRIEFKLDYYNSLSSFYKQIKGFESFSDFKKKMYEHLYGSSTLLHRHNIENKGVYVTLHSVFTYMDEGDLQDIASGSGRSAEFLGKEVSGKISRAIAAIELVRRDS